MTERKEQILATSLKLFATEGFESTSTSKVAKEAGVSEGLIFRHFINKKGLLQAVLRQGHERASALFEKFNILAEPKEIIKAFLDLPFALSEKEKSFWKLQYTLKWQTQVYDEHLTSPSKELLEKAFKDLNYQDPATEAELLLVLLDGLAMTILLKEKTDLSTIRKSILKKYNLTDL